MPVQEKVNQEIKIAMKSKDRFRLNALKYIKSLLQNNLITEKPISELEIVMSHHKKMSKTLDMYKDQALLNLEKEIAIIEEFIPKAMSEEEISALVDKHLSLGNMGQVMQAVKAEIIGPFDGKLVSSLVKSKLK